MERLLVVIQGPDKGRSFPLVDGQTLTVGRGQASDTQINDPRMSRVHCRVLVDGDQTRVVHAGGSGGTLVGGLPVESHDLRPGETFIAGQSEFRYQLGQVREQSTIIGDQQVGAQQVGAARPQPRVAPLKDLVGQSFHTFRLDKIIEGTASGMVFKAFDTEQNRPAAVKVLTPSIANTDEQKERFVRAMKTTLPIRHPNIVRLYNAGKKGPYCWAAMEWVDGENLMAVIDRIGVSGMLDWREVWRVAVHIGRALQEARQQKIVHRNVTPTNILRRSQDKVCLLGDLMLAKALEGTLAKQVTQPGQLVGDVAFMAPERTRDGAEVDCRSDLYGLGATLYALLTGRPPFEGDSLPDLIRMVRNELPRPPRDYQLAVNEKFQDAVMQTLAKEPSARYQTPAAFLKDLDQIGRFNSLEAD